MRPLAVAVLLFVSALFARSQETVYFNALKAEESGNIVEALSLFEEALAIEGPYTDEIQEIVDGYHKALDGEKLDEGEKSLSFRLLGDFSLYGFHYKKNGDVPEGKENAGSFFSSIGGFIDYDTKSVVHSFGLVLLGDFIFAKDTSILDTNNWIFSPGLEYSLMGKSFMIDMGVDFGYADGDGFNPSIFLWADKIFYSWEKQGLGVGFWGFSNQDNPVNVTLSLEWRRLSSYGLSGVLMVGARFAMDSLARMERRVVYNIDSTGSVWDYMPSWDENSDWGEIGGWNYWGGDTVTVFDSFCLSQWLGPAVRGRLNYKFRNNLYLETRMSLFYGFLLDGPSSEVEGLKKLSGTWNVGLGYKPNRFTYYLKLEQVYLHYMDIPEIYNGLYAHNSFLTEYKLGVKFEF
ncbi:MAG: hypothetical protein HUK21_07000 [Fibrobacteraceae bacterium]|nr:hypothetical protein [Fibrobacteraceae bacterium]